VRTLQKNTVFVVVGIWEGMLEEVQVFLSRDNAEACRRAIMQKYDKDADWWEDENPENKNYSVTVEEAELTR
jgi:hypothetical protein